MKPGWLVPALCFFLAALSAQSASADFTKVGTGTVEAVRSSNITLSSATIAPACQYRLQGTLSASKASAYQLSYVSSTLNAAPAAPSFVFAAELTYEQTAELLGNSPSMFVSSQPNPSASPTPSPNQTISLRLTVNGADNARLDMLYRGSVYALRPQFFDLYEQCDVWRTVESGPPSPGYSGSTPLLNINSCTYRLKYTYSKNANGFPVRWDHTLNSTTTEGPILGTRPSERPI